jgi:hypothetical protein
MAMGWTGGWRERDLEEVDVGECMCLREKISRRKQMVQMAKSLESKFIHDCKTKLLQNKAKTSYACTFRPSSGAVPTRESAQLSAAVSQPLNLRRRRQMLRFLLMMPDQATIGVQIISVKTVFHIFFWKQSGRKMSLILNHETVGCVRVKINNELKRVARTGADLITHSSDRRACGGGCCFRRCISHRHECLARIVLGCRRHDDFRGRGDWFVGAAHRIVIVDLRRAEWYDAVNNSRNEKSDESSISTCFL